MELKSREGSLEFGLFKDTDTDKDHPDQKDIILGTFKGEQEKKLFMGIINTIMDSYCKFMGEDGICNIKNPSPQK